MRLPQSDADTPSRPNALEDAAAEAGAPVGVHRPATPDDTDPDGGSP